MYSRRNPTKRDREILAELIRQARIRHGLSQEKLAELLGCSMRWVSEIECAKANPNWKDAFRIAVILEIDPACFVREADSPASVHDVVEETV